LDAGQGTLHQLSRLASIEVAAPAISTVSKALARNKQVSERAACIPLAVHDHEVDIGAVVAGSIREDTHNRVIRTDAGSHCSLRMASDKVELIRFIERRGQSHSLVEKLDGRSKEIAKDARDRQDKVDARASESLERNSLDLHHTVEIVALRSYTKQPERLSD